MEFPLSSNTTGGSQPQSRSIPPPPPESPIEFSIRTMASDIALLGKSGGIPGAIQRTFTEGPFSPAISSAPGSAIAAKDEGTSKLWVWALLGIVGAGILFFVGYYLIPLLFEEKKVSLQTEEPTPISKPASENLPPTPLSFAHTSFFRDSPDHVITVNLYADVSIPSRTSFLAAVEDEAEKASSGTAFFEIVAKAEGGRALLWSELLVLMGATELNQDLFRDSFEADFTMFALKENNALYSGYILKAKEGETPLLLQREFLALESATSSLGALFVSSPGSPSGPFSDLQISGQPARALAFSGTNKLIYGWFFDSYLIISTSEKGLKQALLRL